jgi:hypothetical protein
MGLGSGIRDPGSEIRDPESGIRNPGSGIRDPESGIWNPGSGIRDPEKTYSRSRIQGSKRHRIPDPDLKYCPEEQNLSFLAFIIGLVDGMQFLRRNLRYHLTLGIGLKSAAAPHPTNIQKCPLDIQGADDKLGQFLSQYI